MIKVNQTWAGRWEVAEYKDGAFVRAVGYFDNQFDANAAKIQAERPATAEKVCIRCQQVVQGDMCRKGGYHIAR